MKKIVICLCLLFCINFFSSDALSLDIDEKNVLIITSFGPSNSKFTSDRLDSLRKYFGNDNTLKIYISNIDFNINNSSDYLIKYKEFFSSKYKNKTFDLIICLDNVAGNFVNNNYKELFKDIPVIFCSIDSSLNLDLNSNRFFIIKENFSSNNTIETAIKLHPNRSKIYIPINKDFLSAQTYYNLIEDIAYLKNKYPNKEFILGYNDSISDIKNCINNNYNNIILILTTSLKSSDNSIITKNKTIEYIYEYKKIPIYTYWKSLIDSGAIGGFLIDGNKEGELCAFVSNSILYNNNLNKKIFSIDSKYMFDRQKLIRFNVNLENLPKGSILLNEQVGIYKIPKIYIHAIIALTILTLLLIIIFLLIYIYKNKKLEFSISDNNRQYKKLIEDIPIPIIILDKTTITVMSNSFKTMFCLDENLTYENNNFDTMLPKEIFEGINTKILKSGEKNEATNDCICIQNKYINLIYEPWQLYEKTYHLIIVDDITQKKQKEISYERAKAELNKYKENLQYTLIENGFFYSLSNKIEIPVRKLFYEVKLLLSQNHPCINKVHINKIKENYYAILKFVLNLIYLTELECGYYNLNYKNYNTVNIIESLTTSINKYLKEKNPKNEINFDTEFEEINIAIDMQNMQHIILSLISNAIRFSNSNKLNNIDIYVDLTKDSNNLIISIENKNESLNENTKNKICDIFKIKNKYEKFDALKECDNTFISLYITKKLIHNHGGEIYLKSDNTFIVKLPIRTIDVDTNVNNSKYKTENTQKTNYTFRKKTKIEFCDIFFNNF